MVNPTAHPLQQCRWHRFSSVASLEQAAAQAILSSSQKAIEQKGSFHIVLAGGNTPRNVYRLLRTADADWIAWHVYFGDERCLPQDHPERNSMMAQLAWLDHVAIPRQQIHIIPAELGAQAAAERYARDLANVGEFDLVLLGLGEDGHTASLFPGGEWRAAAAAVLPVHNAPKPPPDRVSLSAQRLSATRAALFMITGQTKQHAVEAWRKGEPIPASWIAPPNGIDIYVDAASITLGAP